MENNAMENKITLKEDGRLPGSVVAYRVGDVDQAISRPIFFTNDLSYYDHSQTGYEKKDAERYSIELRGHKVWDPMTELGLSADTWATVWGKVGDFRRLGIGYDYSDEMDDDELPDNWVVYTSTDELAFAGRRLGYDVVVLRDIPGDNGRGPKYDEYAVNDASCVKRLQRLSESLLLERKRSEILNRSRTGDNYKTRPGENRYTRRTKSRVAATVADYNRIDMDAFFKADMLEFDINVKGETDSYTVTVLFENVLKEIKRNVSQNKGKFEFKCVIQALMRVFNSEDIYVACSCLHPDTKIKLLDGSCPTVREMKDRFDSGEKLYVYSTDRNGDFKPGIVEKVWITKKESRLIKVTLDNGKSIVTTRDHLYMLRDGCYARADELSVGQSLMPMYFNYGQNGYEGIKFNSEERGWHTTYKLVANYFKGDEIKDASSRAKRDDSSKMKYDVAIHHMDFNKSNNNPENLNIMTAKEHWDYHASLTWGNKPQKMKEHIIETSRANAIKRNKNPTEAMREHQRKFVLAGRAIADFRNHDPESLKTQSELMSKTIKEYWNNMSDDDRLRKSKELSDQAKSNWERGCYNTEKFRAAGKKRMKKLNTDDVQRRAGAAMKAYYSNPENVNEFTRKLINTKICHILHMMAERGIDMTEDNYEAIRTTLHGYPRLSKGFSSIAEALSYFNVNHRITSIEFITLDNPIDVYDIKVKDWENFLVEPGVILHNCPDFVYGGYNYYSFKGNYNSNPQLGKALEKPVIRNPNDTKGDACKHILLCLSNLDWIMKIASVINNYVKYCRDRMSYNYWRYIAPTIYDDVEAQKAADAEAKLASDRGTIGKANAAAPMRGRFVKGSNINPAYAGDLADEQRKSGVFSKLNDVADDGGKPKALPTDADKTLLPS